MQARHNAAQCLNMLREGGVKPWGGGLRATVRCATDMREALRENGSTAT